MPFHNEHFSVLLRSLHSLVNRTPRQLLHELILVDDCSDMSDLQKMLEVYVEKHFPAQFVKIVRLKQRQGLIAARLTGARQARGQVLVFLDAHIEVNYNWLPPLLEPIALQRRSVVCPLIDVIDDETFKYEAQDEGARGAFDWNFDYKRLPLRRIDLKNPSRPHPSPVMAGGLFAIDRNYFWELGGYDTGLDIWGGEQYELSFKIWMCGGQLLEAPCSRVGHIFRGDRPSEPNPRKYDYLHKVRLKDLHVLEF